LNFCARLRTVGRFAGIWGVERGVDAVEVTDPDTDRTEGLGVERAAPLAVCWRGRVVVMSAAGCDGSSSVVCEGGAL
jgi:hypothetical protein